MAHVKLTSNPKSLEVDGKRLGGVVSTTVTVAANDIDRCVVELRVLEGTNYEGDAEVTLPDSTVETLKALGWTPPQK